MNKCYCCCHMIDSQREIETNKRGRIMEDAEYFEMVKNLRDVKKIDNNLVVANLLAGIASELRELNKTLKQGVRYYK